MYKYIDLFSGIGGFRLGMDAAGFECVYSAEKDEHAIKMYKENFNDDSANDITKIKPEDIPDFDVLCAGFPCQSFSISGKQQGFYDKTRGTLFFDILRILDHKKPKAFILENVKNLEHHDKGRTLTIMLESLNELGYTVNYRILNAKDFGVPQNRERVVLVGSRENKIFDFENIAKNPVNSMLSFLDKDSNNFEYLNDDEYTLIDKEHIKRQASDLIFVGYRNKKMRINGVKKGTEHLSRVHRQPNRIYSAEGVNPTIASQESSGRYFILLNNKVRKLTLNECFKFMGFPKNFIKIGAEADLYARIGNSICVPMVEAIGKELKKMLENEKDIDNPKQILEDLYKEASDADISINYLLNEEQANWVNTIVSKEETAKAVYTVTLTSLVYKLIHPQQDIRYHQTNMQGGYSGRSFDTKFITPFLKEKRLPAAMKESGWLTRSLEQNNPYDYDYPGSIRGEGLKDSFLNILNDIEAFNANPKPFIINILARSIENQKSSTIELINPIERESRVTIKEIMEMIESHFYNKYTSRGASILPVIAFQSIYRCLVEELSRYENKELHKLDSHYSSDRSSKKAGDIVITEKNSDELYEVIEIKFDVEINKFTILDAYKKIKPTKIQRYYILSTIEPTEIQRAEFNTLIEEIKSEHGCQVIINGLMKTINYYLRLISDTDKFITYYLEELNNHPEINKEHMVAWNTLMQNRN